MKKTISMLIALLMVFSVCSLAACGKDNAQAEATQAPPAEEAAAKAPAEEEPAQAENALDLTKTKPNEYIQEKLKAGMEVMVAYLAVGNNFFTQALSEGITAELTPLGYTVDTFFGEDNQMTQINQIDNCVEMGYSLLIIIATDSIVVKDPIMKAQEAGVSVLLYGEPADYTCVVRLDVYESAWQQSEMAGAWIDKVYPDQEVRVAVLATSANSANLVKKQSYLDYVEQDPQMNLGYLHEQCMGTDAGFTAAQEAMTSFPDTRVFIDFDIGASIGVNNYLLSQINAGLNIDEFGIFAAGEDNNTRNILSLDYTEPTAFRGTILDGETMWDAVVLMANKILNNEVKAPYEFLQPIFAVTNFGYTYDTRLLDK
ncbi:MAG: substrate-binding domain-containing protein [Oscillospiraceae bacterium]|jgi:ABC-type sugar transport system substrate-binding protein